MIEDGAYFKGGIDILRPEAGKATDKAASGASTQGAANATDKATAKPVERAGEKADARAVGAKA